MNKPRRRENLDLGQKDSAGFTANPQRAPQWFVFFGMWKSGGPGGMSTPIEFFGASFLLHSWNFSLPCRNPCRKIFNKPSVLP